MAALSVEATVGFSGFYVPLCQETRMRSRCETDNPRLSLHNSRIGRRRVFKDGFGRCFVGLKGWIRRRVENWGESVAGSVGREMLGQPLLAKPPRKPDSDSAETCATFHQETQTNASGISPRTEPCIS